MMKYISLGLFIFFIVTPVCFILRQWERVGGNMQQKSVKTPWGIWHL